LIGVKRIDRINDIVDTPGSTQHLTVTETMSESTGVSKSTEVSNSAQAAESAGVSMSAIAFATALSASARTFAEAEETFPPSTGTIAGIASGLSTAFPFATEVATFRAATLSLAAGILGFAAISFGVAAGIFRCATVAFGFGAAFFPCRTTLFFVRFPREFRSNIGKKSYFFDFRRIVRFGLKDCSFHIVGFVIRNASHSRFV